MTEETRRFTVALLTSFAYGDAISQIADPSGRAAVIFMDNPVIMVPRGDQPTVRDLRDDEAEAFVSLHKDGHVPFLPTKCVEFVRCFFFVGAPNDLRPMMFGTGFGIFVAGDGQPQEVKEVEEIEYALAKALFGQHGLDYEGELQSTEVELTKNQARFNFAQTIEVATNSVRFRAQAFAEKHREEMRVFGQKLAQEMSDKYLDDGGVYGREAVAWLFEGEDMDDSPAGDAVDAVFAAAAPIARAP